MNFSFVIDCSVTMTWILENERTDATDAIQDRLAVEAAIVPAHWPLEVANVLATAERRGSLTEADSTRFVQLLAGLPIEIDRAAATSDLELLLAHCRAHALTSYDAAYLELALQHQLPLATLDQKLRQVATAVGLRLEL